MNNDAALKEFKTPAIKETKFLQVDSIYEGGIIPTGEGEWFHSHEIGQDETL